MDYALETPISVLPGIGTVAARDFKRLGVETVEDLLFYFPFRYDDHSEVKPIAEAEPGETVTLQGRISSIKSRRSWKKKMTLTEAILEDDSGKIKVVWFNQPYIAKNLKVGDPVSFAGRIDDKYGVTLVNPVYERVRGGETVHTGRIVPIYPLSGSLTQKRIRAGLNACLNTADLIAEWLPEEVIEGEKFPSLSEALKTIHFPKSNKELSKSVNRLKFEELFLHQIMFALARRKLKKLDSVAIEPAEGLVGDFVSQLPYELTAAQQKSVKEIVADLAVPHPMNRMLQGDVGSGKTVVSAVAALVVASAGKQVIYLAPTEILAAQQYETFKELLPEMEVALCTRSQCKISGSDVVREKLEAEINAGLLPVVIATHTVLEEKFDLPELALVIVDEQHRFGVRQRQRLFDRHSHAGLTPHLLSMSATPIPRSLALSIYGDLDISILDELPAGRKPIETLIVAGEKTGQEMYATILSEIESGHQAYVVAPLIDPSDKLGAKSVTEVAEHLKKSVLKDTRIEILHGKLKPNVKDKVIQAFSDGEIDVLVSTTVVEVGVNVPNATVMFIEGAERFGLAQLHQLRGRVGRSDVQSFCFLHPSEMTENAQARLGVMVETTDGFVLAERDLEFRGPGNLFGNAQSGFPDFKLATMADVALMKRARDWSQSILERDGELKSCPGVLRQLKAQVEQVHFE